VHVMLNGRNAQVQLVGNLLVGKPLDKALQHERYEDAAKLRDEIKRKMEQVE